MVLTDEQYASVLEATAALGGREECFAVLAWETGRRSASIRQLRWSDVDLGAGRIHFRGENDETGHDHRNPLHAEAVAISKREQARTSSIADAWIFPAAQDRSRPMPRHTVQRLWQRLARKANIPPTSGYGWHSFRRAFANRLRHVPMRDLQDLGGWKSSVTVMKVYLRSDETAQRAALECAPRRARAAVSG